MRLSTWAYLLSMMVFILLICPLYAKERVKNPTLPEYECRRRVGKIVIDGEINEPAWEKAQVINLFFVPESLDLAKAGTEARLLWDDTYLYVAIRAYDKDICYWGEERDSVIFRGDVLELFLKPSDNPPYYYEIDFNPKNVIYDSYSAYERAGQWRFSYWNAPIDSKVKIKGTLESWEDEDEWWQVEFRVPFSSLPSLKGRTPKVGDVWRFHVARYNYSVYLKGIEYSSCAILPKLNYHDISRFCYLKFVP